MPKPKKEDGKLVVQLKSGNVAAFDALFEKYGQKLYGFALTYFKSENEAEELVQQVFVRIWEKRRLLKSEYSFKSYLFTIALNQIRKYYNRRANSLRYLAHLKLESFEEDNRTEESIDYNSVLQRIEKIIETLPARKKLIFIKSRMEGKSSREIARELDITVGTVDNQVSDAIRIIREIMENENLAIILFLFLFFLF